MAMQPSNLESNLTPKDKSIHFGSALTNSMFISWLIKKHFLKVHSKVIVPSKSWIWY
jgi:hypothetical protein